MPNSAVAFRAFIGALLCVAVLGGCGGSHSGQSTLPPIPNSKLRTSATAAATAGDLIAINAGGAATGAFAADQDFATSSWTYTSSSVIDTTSVSNAAPQAVYQTEREGSTVAYTIPGLTAGTAYTVKLSFAELWWTTAGQRVFNVSLNNTKVLTNFDIVATAGARNKAIVESFTATASASGTIVITLSAVTNYAAISAIEIAATGATPTPTPTPTGSGATTAINAGGAASGAYIADTDFASAGTWTSATTSAIDTTGVTNPAPAAVYQDQRVGYTIAYTIPGLTASAAYTVRLDFAEIFFAAAGQRVFNASISNTKVLSNFDIYAAAGARNRAVAESFNTTASSTGTIAITFNSVTNYATVNAISITAASGTGATPTPPAATPTVGFNDYPTFGYDNERDVYNPNSTAITPASVSNIHLAWQATLGGGDYNTQTQPILATGIAGHSGVLYVGGGSGNVYGYDASSGALLWTRPTGQETYTCENGYTAYFGVGGTVAYDASSRSLYVVGNTNGAPNAIATNSLYHLDGASGAVLGQINFAPATAGWPSLDFSHTAVTLGNNGLAYVATSATCDISSWRGRVAAVSVPSMTLASTFYPVWSPPAQPWGGGGIWGWGGVSLDFSNNVFFGVGNTDNGTTAHGTIVSPFQAAPQEYSGLGDAFVKMSSDLTTLEDSNHPIPVGSFGGVSADLDINGTPAIFRPNGTGCNPMAALQAKSGALYLYDTTQLAAGPRAQYQLAPSTYSDGFLGGPAYSAATGLLYAAVPSSSGSLYPPGMIAINPGCGSPSVTWHSAFGPDSYPSGVPRSVPAVSAGGVVFVGTICSPDGNSGCSASATSSTARKSEGARRKPSICCAPTGPGDGALWALDASTGAVLNGGNPLIYTSGPLRVPPTIDGNWIFVLDNNGDMYGLTIDSSIAAIASKARSVSPRMLTHWESRPAAP